MKIVLVLVGLVLASCTKSEEKKAEAPSPQVAKVGSYEYKVGANAELSNAQIKSLTYEVSRHSLLISIQYSGCRDTTHSLIFSDICMLSYPSQCGATITHEKGFDSRCEALHHEDMLVVLKDEQNEMVLTVSTQDGSSAAVLIDRDGRVKAATTP